MKLAIHKSRNSRNSFSSKWIEYCQKNQIGYKIVNCYDNDIIDQVDDCDALMWHFNQSHPKDALFAKELMFSLEAAGKKVFPNFNTAWHFDDKVGQKYLLEAIGAPLVPSYVFYEQEKALEWAEETTYPKVFKLRRGAGSAHVKMAKDKSDAEKLIKKAFAKGFSQYDKIANLKDRWYKYRKGKTDLWDVVKGVLRFGKTTEFAKTMGNEKGYIYFQDFIPDNQYDIRVIVINKKAFAIKRLVREGDFKASGSGHLLYEKHHFDKETIKTSFKVSEKLNSQSLAIDYVYQQSKPLVTEISYGFPSENFIEGCTGYWDRNLVWHEGTFDAMGWMVEALLGEISSDYEYKV